MSASQRSRGHNPSPLKSNESPDSSLDHLLGGEPLPPRPNPDQELDDSIAEFLAGEPQPSEMNSVLNQLVDAEIDSIMSDFDEEDIRTRASRGLDAIGQNNLVEAAGIFRALHEECPNDPNIRDTYNYVEGLYHGQSGSR